MTMTRYMMEVKNFPNAFPKMNENRGKLITYKILRRKDRVNDTGRASIYFSCFLMGKPIKIFTGLEATASEWNDRQQCFRGNTAEVRDHNLILDDYEKTIKELRIQVRLGKLKLTPQVFKARVLNAAINTDFFAYFAWKITQRSRIAANTARKEQSVLNVLRKWRSQLLFSEIDQATIDRFISYMKVKRKNKQPTVQKNAKVLGHYLRMAIEDGFNFEYPKGSFKGIPAGDGRIEYLTRDEVKKAIEVYHSGILPSHLQATLRQFLFACFTGLRYGDWKYLGPENFIENKLVIAPEKGYSVGRIISIHLNNTALQFCHPHAEKPIGRVISNQKTNKNLKDLKPYLGIDKNLTCHVSRHTFATQYLEIGGKLERLQKILGHSKITQTMVYAHVSEHSKAEDMRKFDEFF